MRDFACPIMADLRAGIGQKTWTTYREAPHPLRRPTGQGFCRRWMRRWLGWGDGGRIDRLLPYPNTKKWRILQEVEGTPQGGRGVGLAWIWPSDAEGWQ